MNLKVNWKPTRFVVAILCISALFGPVKASASMMEGPFLMMRMMISMMDLASAFVGGRDDADSRFNFSSMGGISPWNGAMMGGPMNSMGANGPWSNGMNSPWGGGQPSRGGYGYRGQNYPGQGYGGYPQHTRAPVEGVWQSMDGESAIALHGDRFNMYYGGQPVSTANFQLQGNRLVTWQPQSESAQEFLVQVKDNYLALQNPTGQIVYFQRQRSPRQFGQHW